MACPQMDSDMCKKYVKVRQSWKEVTPVVHAPCPALNRPSPRQLLSQARTGIPQGCAGQVAGNWLSRYWVVVAELMRLSHERPQQQAACIEGEVLMM